MYQSVSKYQVVEYVGTYTLQGQMHQGAISNGDVSYDVNAYFLSKRHRNYIIDCDGSSVREIRTFCEQEFARMVLVAIAKDEKMRIHTSYEHKCTRSCQ